MPAHAKKLPGGLVYGDYDLRLYVSMKSDFSFNPVMSTSCGEPKLAGYAGSPSRSPRPSCARTSSGDFTQYVCGEASATKAAACTGTFPLRLDASISFLYSACGTTWTWKANLRKARAKKGRH